MPAITPEQTAQFRAAFDASDVDGSGSIEAGELAKVLSMLGEDSDAGAVAELLAEMDTDADGTISFAEFTAMMMSRLGLDAADDASEAELRRRASTIFVEADRTPTKSGWMEKRSTSGKFRNWKRRYFLLLPDRLQYFVNEKAAEEGKIKGEVVFVSGCDVTEAPQLKPGCFALNGAKQLHLVVADSTERDEWISAINGALEAWQGGIVQTLALLCGDDPMAATKHMMQADNYMTVMQAKNGVCLSPIYVRMGQPVPIIFEWDWDSLDGVTSISYAQRQLGGGTEWADAELAGKSVELTMKPGNGYSFFYNKGDEKWVSPLQEMPSLLWKLRGVPLLGAVLRSLPDAMQRKIDLLPEGKVRDLLEKVADFMPQNPFDVNVQVRIEQGLFVAEEQVLSKAQAALKLRDDKLSDPAIRFAVRSGYLNAALLVICKGFEMVGLGFLGNFIKDSINVLFMPNKAATREGLQKLAEEKELDGTRKFDSLEEMWARKAEDYADDLNADKRHFMGGIKVKMPTPDQVLRAAVSRMPRVKEGATLPVLFQWPGDAADVKLLICEMSGPLKEREEKELKAKTEAKAIWSNEQVAILKKKLGFETAAEDEELKLTPFKYERPEREVIKKDWREITLAKVKESSAPPPAGKEKAKKCKFAIDVPLPTGDYCYKYVVDGKQMYKVTKALDTEDDGSYKMFYVRLACAFGLGFDVGA